MHEAKIFELEAFIAETSIEQFKLKVASDPTILSTPHEGLTVFQYLCNRGPVNLLKTIIDNLTEAQLKSLIEMPKPADWFPAVLEKLMFTASQSEDDGLLKNCLLLGANANAADALENRPLHYVMMGRNESTVKKLANILLEFDIDEHVKNAELKTAIDLADRGLADWFIQRSRSIRLQELRILQKKVSALQETVGTLEIRMTSLLSTFSMFASRHPSAMHSVDVIESLAVTRSASEPRMKLS